MPAPPVNYVATARCLSSLCLSFLSCKMRLMLVSPHRGAGDKEMMQVKVQFKTCYVLCALPTLGFDLRAGTVSPAPPPHMLHSTWQVFTGYKGKGSVSVDRIIRGLSQVCVCDARSVSPAGNLPTGFRDPQEILEQAWAFAHVFLVQSLCVAFILVHISVLRGLHRS